MKTSRFLLRGFRRPREIACFALGKLERQVMEETWRLGEVTVRDIYRAFEERIAYTTLMTTLDRLFKKKLLERRKDGRAFLYAAVVSRDELDRGIKEDVVDGLLGQGADGVEPVLACIVDTISERDRELLDELDRLVQEKKRELRRKSLSMYTFLGITLVLALLLTINATATMAVGSVLAVCANRSSGNAPHARALKYSSSCASDHRYLRSWLSLRS